MKVAKLAIGSNKSGSKFDVVIDFDIPETDAEVAQVCKVESVRVARFVRADRIACQETSGAREYVSAMSQKDRDEHAQAVKEGKTSRFATEIAQLVSEYRANPDTVRKSGRPSTPKEVVIEKDALSKKDLEKMSAILKAQGITVTIR
jgi:hypothetical protein